MKEEEIRPRAIFQEYLEMARDDIGTLFGDVDSFVDVPCLACGCSRRKQCFTKDGFGYVSCNECSTLFVSPRPSQAVIDKYYRISKSSKFWATTFYKETEAVRREKLFKPKAQLIKSMVTKYGIETGALLEAGAGYGTFCEELTALNTFKEIFALEPSPPLAGVCRKKGLRVIESTMEGVDAKYESRFDIAVSLELFEHLFSLQNFLNSVSRVLRRGGHFIFSTLNGMGWDMLVLKEHSDSISPPHHLNFLNPRSAVLMAQRNGWDVVDLFTPGKLDVDIVVNFSQRNPSVKLTPFAEEILASGKATQQAFQDFLAKNRLSSHMWVVLKKVDQSGA